MLQTRGILCLLIAITLSRCIGAVSNRTKAVDEEQETEEQTFQNLEQFIKRDIKENKNVKDEDGNNDGENEKSVPNKREMSPNLKAKLDELKAIGNGQKKLDLPAGCNFEKENDKIYTSNNYAKSSCHFGLIWDKYFKSMYKGNDALSRLSRGVIGDPSDFLFNKGSSILIRKSLFAFTRLTKSTGQNVLPWLNLINLRIHQLVIDFEHATDEDPLDIAISGTVKTLIGSQNIALEIHKPLSDGKLKDTETDVTLDFLDNNNYGIQPINVERFLKFAGNSNLDSLYGDSTKFEDFLTLRKMSVKKKEDGKHLKIILMGEQTWDAYLYGSPVSSANGNNALYNQMNSVMIYCKSTTRGNKEENQLCAMASTFKDTQLGFLKQKNPFISNDIVDQLQQIPLIKDANAAGLFTSNEGIEYPTLKDDLDAFNNLRTVTGNSDKKLDIYEKLAVPGFCFRFRNEKTSKELSFKGSYEGPLIVHACVDENGEVEVIFPDDWSGNTIEYQGLEKIAFSNVPYPNIGLKSDALMKFISIKISLNDAGNAETCQGFKPADKILLVKDSINDKNDEEGYKRLFLRNTEIKQCYLNNEWIFKGTGNEILWALETPVEIKQKSRRVGIETPMNIHSTKQLMRRTKANFNADWFVTKYPDMEDFPLKEIRTEIFFQKRNTALIKGKTDLPGVENGRIHFLYYNKHDESELALCINKQGMQLSKIMERMFKKGIADKWKVYEEGNVILRQHSRKSDEPPFENIGSCRQMESEEEEFRLRDTKISDEFEGGMLVKAYGINLERCSTPGTEEFNNICHFLWKANAKKPILPGTYYGKTMKEPAYFRMDGDLPENYQLVIGDFQFHGSTYQRGHGQFPKRIFHRTATIELGHGYKNYEDMYGLIQVGSENFDAHVEFVGDRVLFTIAKSDLTSYQQRIYKYFPFVRFRTRNKPHEDITNTHLEFIEMESRLNIGSSSLSFVTKTSKQYLYPKKNDKRNRYWGCIKQVFLKQLFQVFKQDFKHSILSDARLTGCFTYHQMQENWKIDSLLIDAEPGFRFYGVVEGYGKIEAEIKDNIVDVEIVLNPIKSKIKFNPSSVSEEDPLFDDLDSYIDEKQGESALEFYSEDQDFNKGPTLRISIGPGTATASLEGFIFMIGYQGKASMDLLPEEECTNGKDCEFTKYHFDNTINSKPTKIYGEITGDLVLTGTCEDKCENFGDIDFNLRIDLTNAKELQPSPKTMQLVANTIREEYQLDKVNKNINDLQEIIDRVKTTENKNKRSLYLAEKHSKIAKLQRARSIQASKKSCISECPTVKMPGFTTKDCYKTKQGNQAQCLSYSPNQIGNVSNVGCLSKCESEKVMAFVKAKKMDRHYKMKMAAVEKRKNILKRSTNMGTAARNKAELPNLKSYSSFLIELAKNDQKTTLQITKMISSGNVKNLESPDCLPFKVSYHIRANNDEFSRHKNDQDLNICFNGGFANDAYHKIVENAYQEELKKLVDYISEVKMTIPDKIATMIEDLKAASNKREEIEGVPNKIWGVNVNTLSLFTSSSFHVHDPATVYAFNEKAPWVLLEHSDPFTSLTEVNIKKNASFIEPQASDACAVARSNVDKMQGMVKFVKRWLTSHHENKRYLDQVKNYVNGELTQMRQYIGQLKANKTLHQIDNENMKYWSNITENGMAKWIDLSTSQMEQLETKGPMLVRNEIKNAFIGKTASSFEDYIGETIKTTSEAYTRMNIPASNNDKETFSSLSNNFMQLFKGGTTLTEMSKQVNKVESSLQTPYKRTLSCSMKM